MKVCRSSSGTRLASFVDYTANLTRYDPTIKKLTFIIEPWTFTQNLTKIRRENKDVLPKARKPSKPLIIIKNSYHKWHSYSKQHPSHIINTYHEPRQFNCEHSVKTYHINLYKFPLNTERAVQINYKQIHSNLYL